jgi:hypothetical protein
MKELRSKKMDFEKELEVLINKHSMENASDTPDFILAGYLKGCLDLFNTAVQQRETLHGRDPRPVAPTVAPTVAHSDTKK